jgi:hypothetical protein
MPSMLVAHWAEYAAPSQSGVRMQHPVNRYRVCGTRSCTVVPHPSASRPGPWTLGWARAAGDAIPPPPQYAAPSQYIPSMQHQVTLG